MKAQEWETPIIENYGKIVHYEQVEDKPGPNQEYKIIFHIKDGKEREGVNDGLWKIARVINLMGSYKVPEKNVKLVAIISGTATSIVLTDKEYTLREGVGNPNLDLLSKLKEHGVKLLVCGQALAKHKISHEKDLNPYFEISTSALMVIPHYQLKGYLPMF